MKDSVEYYVLPLMHICKIIFTGCTFITLIFLPYLLPNASAGDNTPTLLLLNQLHPIVKGTGVLAPSAKDRAWMEMHVPRLTSPSYLPGTRTIESVNPLPARVVNIKFLPKVGNQAYGSCTSWALAYYYKTWQEAREHKWLRPDPAVDPQHVMSPAFVFNLSNGGDASKGSSMAANLEYLLDYGTCSCADMKANAAPFNWPSEKQFLSAFPYRAKSASQIDYKTDDGFLALKQHLASGDLAVFTMGLAMNFVNYPAAASGINNNIYFMNSGGKYFPKGGGSNGHALCIIGYDDAMAYTDSQGQTRHGAVLVVNSWGTNWGVETPETKERGFIWIGYDYFRTMTEGNAYIMVDRIGYKPTLVGSFHIQHGRRAEVSVTLMGGDRNAPDWQYEVFPRTGGNRPIDATIAFDATDYANVDNYSWWLKVTDYDLPELFTPDEVGNILSFKIKRRDGILWESPDAPAATGEVDGGNTVTWLNAGLLYQRKDILPGFEAGISAHTWGDLDGDGDYDLIVYNQTHTTDWVSHMRIFRNDGGTLTEIKSTLPDMGGHQSLGDYDGDGKPDLVMNGYDEVLGKSVTKIMKNIGDCSFIDSGIKLPGSTGRVEWIDYDNDGRLDLSLNEYDEKTHEFTGLKVYHNNSDGTFSAMGLGLPQSDQYAWADYNRDGRLDLALVDFGGTHLYHQTDKGALAAGPVLPGTRTSGLAWGDVDNDGWLDLALTAFGKTQSGEPPAVTQVWRNKGDGTFAEYSQFAGATDGGLSWGDFDNDGLPDLCVWGDYGRSDAVAGVNIHTKVWRNKGNGKFQDMGFNLWGVGWTGEPDDYVHWVDFDNDGDLDLSIAGKGSQTDGWPRAFMLYENRTAQPGGLNRPDHFPSVPAIMTSHRIPNGPIELSWSGARDLETPEKGLYYNVRVGTNPGWGDLLPADVSAPLRGFHLRTGLDADRTGLILNIPTNKSFFWSVQTIDPAQGHSAWSLPQLYHSPSTPLPGDVNKDGSIDIADVVKTVRMSNGQETPEPAVADRNGDGRVDTVDVDLTEAILLGTGDTGDRAVAGAVIGSGGGALAAEGFKIVIPADSFSNPASIKIDRRESDRPFGSDSVSPLYRIQGMPADFTKPVCIHLAADNSGADGAHKPLFLAVGEMVHPYDSETASRVFNLFPAIYDTDSNDYVCTLLPSGIGRKTTTSSVRTILSTIKSTATADDSEKQDNNHFTLSVYVSLLDNYAVLKTPHFRIIYPADLSTDPVINLGKALEKAYDTFKNTFGFSYAARTRWPIQVTVRDMKSSGMYGEFVASKLGNNYGWMEINSTNIQNTSILNATAMHEFFHFVQSLYDPRPGFIKATFGGGYLWIDEAASVWSEAMATGAPKFSDLFENNFTASLKGMIAGGTGNHKTEQNHGYGMAAIIKYMQMKKGNTWPHMMFDNIYSGKTPAEAIRLTGPTGSDFSWWSDYLKDLIMGKCYPVSIGQLAQAIPKGRQFKISGEGDLFRSKSYSTLMPDLAGVLHMAFPIYTGLKDTDTLSCRLNTDLREPALRLFMLKVKAGEPGEVIGEAQPANGALKFDVPDLNQLQAEKWKIMAMVTNERAVSPYTDLRTARFRWAVTGEKKQDLPARTVTAKSYQVGIPVISCSGSFKGKGWSDLQTLSFGNIPAVQMNLPGETPTTFDFTYTGSITTGSMKIPNKNGYETFNVYGIKDYRFDLSGGDGSAVSEVSHDSGGHFSFDVNTDDRIVAGTVYAVYDVIDKTYNKKDEIISQTTDSNIAWPILTIIILP